MTDREPDSVGPLRDAQGSVVERAATIGGVEDRRQQEWPSWALIDAISQ